MKRIKIHQLIVLERILMEIEDRYKFDMLFSTAYSVMEWLKTIGKITDYAIMIQEEYQKATNDIEGLKAYHKKVMEDEIELGIVDNVISFIDEISKGKDIEKIIQEVKFW